MLAASVKVSLWDFRSSYTFLVPVIQGRPGGFFQLYGGDVVINKL